MAPPAPRCRSRLGRRLAIPAALLYTAAGPAQVGGNKAARRRGKWLSWLGEKEGAQARAWVAARFGAAQIR